MPSSSGDRDPVESLAEEFLSRRRRGERPTVDEYAARHPDLADAIRAVFPAMALVDDLKAGPRPVGQGVRPAVLHTVAAADQVGDYRIIREIGRGGMGVVYEAEQVSLGRRVALKLLPPMIRPDSKHRGRFEREARAAARLHHTNIVPVFGVGEHDGAPYYVMQLIEGRGLDAVIQELRRMADAEAVPARAHAVTPRATPDPEAESIARSLITSRPGGTAGSAAEATTDLGATTDLDATADHTPTPVNGAALIHGEAVEARGPRPSPVPSASSHSLFGAGSSGSGRTKALAYWRAVGRVGSQVADALAYAHAQGIVHRDIKPSNLLLDPGGSVWVADFGLAKADDAPNLTESGDLLGTLRYMPPEAFEGKSDARGDIYSLGLTLYEMIALRPAFDEPDRGRLIRAVTDGEPARLRKLNPSVPRDLETIVHKAIERDPGHRYPTAAALAEDLKRFLDDRPITARRVSEMEKLWRWCRRNPLPASLASAFVAALILGIAASSYYAVREGRANRDLRESVFQQQRRVALAMDAVKTFHGEVSGDLLLKQEQFAVLRTKLLTEAANFYAQLEDLIRNQDDPESRSALAMGYEELAGLTATIGDKQAALAVARKALAVRRDLASRPGAGSKDVYYLIFSLLGEAAMRRENGDNAGAMANYEEARGLAEAASSGREGARFQPLMGLILGRIGDVRETLAQPAAALASYAAAVAIFEPLAAADPSDERPRGSLADLYRSIGRVNAAMGRYDRALASYKQALAIWERPTPRDGGVDYRSGLTSIFGDIGYVHEKLGQPDLALAAHEKSLAIAKEVAAESPAVGSLQQNVALAQERVGNLLAAQGRRAEALEVFKQMASLCERLATSNPAYVDYGLDHARALKSTGDTLMNMGRPDQAIPSYQKALGIEERLAAAHPRHRRIQIHLATQCNQLGRALAETGRPREGLEMLRRAATIREQLVKDAPELVDTRTDLAVTLTELGLTLSQAGRHAEAITTARRVIEIMTPLAEANPNVVDYQDGVGAALFNAGESLARMGRVDDAADFLGKSEAIYARLSAENPKDLRFRKNRVLGHFIKSEMLAHAGRLDQALEDARKGVALLEPLVASYPDDTEMKAMLASIYTHAGNLLSRKGEAREALSFLEKGKTILEQLASAHPDVTLFGEKLAHVYTSTGVVMARSGRAADGLAWLGKARTMGEQRLAAEPNNPDKQARMASILSKIGTARGMAGDHAGAVSSQRESIAIMEHLSRTPDQDFGLGCYQALLAAAAAQPGSGMSAAEAEAEAARAVATLRHAIKLGFSDLGALRSDEDLDGLRNRADFKALLMDATMPVDVFAH